MYDYWGKAECEFFISGLFGDDCEKVDLWKQIEPNLDIITEYVNQKCDLNLFNKEELGVMKYIKNKFKNKTSKELSDWSHNFKGWKETENGHIINYNYSKYLDLD